MDQPASLAEKIEATREIMSRVLADYGPGRAYVAWTGGKDSTSVLYLWRGVLAERAPGERVRALSIDTGLKFPEIVAFRERVAAEWGVDLHVVRPGIDISAYPVAEDKLACCRDLKIEPLKRAIREMGVSALLTGVRADEHPERAHRRLFEEMSDPAHVRVNPLLAWTEMDVWALAMDKGLPYCELYDQGYRSIGCVPCTTRPEGLVSERAGRDQDKEKQLGLLHSLGYF